MVCCSFRPARKRPIVSPVECLYGNSMVTSAGMGSTCSDGLLIATRRNPPNERLSRCRRALHLRVEEVFDRGGGEPMRELVRVCVEMVHRHLSGGAAGVRVEEIEVRDALARPEGAQLVVDVLVLVGGPERVQERE